MEKNQLKMEKINKWGIRIILILLIPIVVLSAILILETRTLNYGNILKELEDVFGEGMILGVHDMGDGLISSVVMIDGIRKSEQVYLDAIVKLRDFANRISKYSIKNIHEIEVVIGLRDSIDDDNIISYTTIHANTLKSVNWESINSYEELNRHLKINLQ